MTGLLVRETTVSDEAVSLDSRLSTGRLIMEPTFKGSVFELQAVYKSSARQGFSLVQRGTTLNGRTTEKGQPDNEAG